MTTARELIAEALGTALLVATVVGSGIMAQRLAGGNVALALLCNTIPTGAILFVLISVFGPVSGAHFNPAVTGVMLLRGALGAREASGYALVQIIGGIGGAIVANAMFDMSPVQIASTVRTGTGQWLGELVATFGLVLTILGLLRANTTAIPAAVGLYVTAAYWFTSSTSFANPAVTIARVFSDSFSGIAPSGVAMFVLMQGLGALAAHALARVLWPAAD